MNPIALIEAQAVTRRALDGAVPEHPVERQASREPDRIAHRWLAWRSVWLPRSPDGRSTARRRQRLGRA